MLGSERANGIDVEGVAIEVDRHDRRRAVGNLRLNRGRIQRVVIRVNIGKDWRGSGQSDRVGRGCEGEGRNNDFVAGAYAGG